MKTSRRSGFRKIDNALFKAILSAKLTGAGYQVILKVIDETNGFQRKEAKIPLTRFQRDTGLSRQSVRKAIKQAEERRIIRVERNGTRPSVYGLCDPSEWLTSKPNHPSKLGNDITLNWATKSPQTRKPLEPATTMPKETLKENIKEKCTYKETVRNYINSHEGTSPPQTPPFLIKVEAYSGEGSTADENSSQACLKKTHEGKIIGYLKSQGPSSIKAISLDTGIAANSVNVTLHNGKGKIFHHDSINRIWGLIDGEAE